MKLQSYKVSFQPIGSFYFGNEQTLGPDNADYFASSNYMPQQTTILGVLRYRLLEMKGWLKDHTGQSNGEQSEREKLIGPRGFSGNPPKNGNGFGAIKSLSPIWIQQERMLLMPGALNRHYNLKKFIKQEKNKSAEEEMWVALSGPEKSPLPELENFDYKNPVESHFICLGKTDTVQFKDVFQEDVRVGITKKKDDEPDTKAFFKQQKLRFKKEGTSFVCYVTLSEKEGDELSTFVKENPHIPMGGERSIFSMTMKEEELDKKLFDIYLDNTDRDQKQTQIVFLSHAKVDPTIYDRCDFAITQTKDFRHIRTDSQTKNHYDKPHKSGAYQLLTAGSVFYVEDETVLENQLTNEVEAFRQIGYNAYIIIKNGSVIPKLYKY